jgi:hypothetical protein
MGSLNDAFSQNKMTFSKVEKILENLLSQKKISPKIKIFLKKLAY